MQQVSNEISEDQGQLIEKVRNRNLTYLDYSALVDLSKTVISIENQQLNGVFVEAGCALGGSTLIIASVKKTTRPFYVYDTFGMIPPPSQQDDEDIHQRYETIVSGKSVGISGEKYYGYEDNLLNKVKETFIEFNIPPEENEMHFVRGTYEKSLILNDPVAFAHIDCDWYESVKVCLERIEPKLVSGGVFIIDDYYTWSGCSKAVDSYFRNRSDEFNFVNKSRLHIIKK